MPEAAALARKEGSGRAGRVTNRDRILEASLELFNERGVSAVSTNTISAHLAISPGNLYYHFANKEQIVRELWTQMGRAAAPSIAVPEDGSLFPPERLAEFLLTSIDSIWTFRFLFRDATDLVAGDREFAETFRTETQWSREHLVVLFDSLIANGAMLGPADHRDVERLCANLQLLFFNWVGFATTSRAGQSEISPADLDEGCLHAFVMVEPYLTPPYAHRVRAALERHLNGDLGRRIAPAPPSARRRRKAR